MTKQRDLARFLPIIAASLMALCLAGCQATDLMPAPQAAVATPQPAALDAALPATTPTVEDTGDVQYFPSDEPLRLAVEHFNRGHYGLAERYFQDAVERAPKDVAAWIGLAASYDRLGRFDLADRAYRSAIRLKGETTQILNNEGYSYMLRGDLNRARAKFQRAHDLDPENPTIINNLHLLDESSRYIVRAPDASTIQ